MEQLKPFIRVLITEELFCKWLLYFKEFPVPAKDDPVLSVLNSYTNRIALRMYNYCLDKWIIIASV
jgi:hypothetical protein